MNKPYQSIALELYNKLLYKLDKNIWIKIMKEVKKDELSMNYNKPYYINYIYLDVRNRYPNIFSIINKRSYYMYLLKKFFNKYKFIKKYDTQFDFDCCKAVRRKRKKYDFDLNYYNNNKIVGTIKLEIKTSRKDLTF